MTANLKLTSTGTMWRDLSAALVVFVVSLPLCLGIALASGAPVFAGILSGVIGGVIVGLLSGSPTSVSGPGNSMVAVASAQIIALGSFESFLAAVFVAGVMQIALGIARAGSLSAFVPSSVVKGLLAAIGIILVMKQLPHLLGHDTDPEGEMSLFQPDHETTFSELLRLVGHIHVGAAVIGIASVALLIAAERFRQKRRLFLPEQLLVVLFGVAMGQLFARFGSPWAIGPSHLVQVPVAESFASFTEFFHFPAFAEWKNPALYRAALTIALVASLESLLSLEAAARIDPRKRTSSPSRELCAQGVGNVAAGLFGGIPVSSVIVRSSINISAGAQTKMAAIYQGLMIVGAVVLLPTWINRVPLSCLGAILLVAGFKLTSPRVYRDMAQQGRSQFLPFILTVVAIVFSDLLIGVVIGLIGAISFILASNLRHPLRRVAERHPSGDVLRIELANQVSFLNRAVLSRVLNEVPRGAQVLLDASGSEYIDPDVLELLREFQQSVAPARGVEVSLRGFRDRYEFKDRIQYLDYATRELQEALTPTDVLNILREGHWRFRAGRRLTRDLDRQVAATGAAQYPLAIILSCIDSRTPAELIFDLGVGDIFVVRVAGNICCPEVLGSLEYGCKVARARLILVLGHTRCGAVTTAVDTLGAEESIARLTGCPHVEPVLREIHAAIPPELRRRLGQASPRERERAVTEVARANVRRTEEAIMAASSTIRELVAAGSTAVVGALYDVTTGDLEFLDDAGPQTPPTARSLLPALSADAPENSVAGPADTPRDCG